MHDNKNTTKNKNDTNGNSDTNISTDIKPETDLIRHQNDGFRTGSDQSIPGQFMFTQGVMELIRETKDVYVETVSAMVMAYDKFDADSDPYNEHDFGSFEVADQKLFWKIDLFDPNLEYGSSDPANPEVTIRILTIMLASEY